MNIKDILVNKKQCIITSECKLCKRTYKIKAHKRAIFYIISNNTHQLHIYFNDSDLDLLVTSHKCTKCTQKEIGT